jgi:hypothetical protein
VKILFERKWIGATVATHDRRLTLLSETPEGFATWEKSKQAFRDQALNLYQFYPKTSSSTPKDS